MSRTVNLSEELYETLQSMSENDHTTLKHEIEQVLNSHLKKTKLLNEVWDGISVEQVLPNNEGVVLKNLKERKFYDVTFKDNQLTCQQDRSKGCMHTSYVWMQFPELLDVNASK